MRPEPTHLPSCRVNLVGVLKPLILFLYRHDLADWLEAWRLKRDRQAQRADKTAMRLLVEHCEREKGRFARRQRERYDRFQEAYEVLRARFRKNVAAMRELDQVKGKRKPHRTREARMNRARRLQQPPAA